MKKLFISKNINRLSFDKFRDLTIIAVTDTAEHFNDEVDLVNYYYDESHPRDANELWKLSKAIESLSQADVAYFPKGWESSNEARIQHMLAEEYGITIIEEKGECKNEEVVY